MKMIYKTLIICSCIVLLQCFKFRNNIVTQMESSFFGKDTSNSSACNSTGNCLFCRENKCLVCNKGFYKMNNDCVERCPENYWADNISLQCKDKKSRVIFMRVFTKSRCFNNCNTKFADCSCKSDCKSNGSCCSDYDYCEFISRFSKTNCPKNCNICNGNKCLNCDKNSYLFKEKCIAKCPSATTAMTKNKVCVENFTCENVNKPNCAHCNFDGKCMKCVSGTFLYQNRCLEVCPAGMYANRAKGVCVTDIEKSFYWVFPSKVSCKGKCGSYSEEEVGCSRCQNDCQSKGNCCDDYTFNCKNNSKALCLDSSCNSCKNGAVKLNNECECKDDYTFEINMEKCIPPRGKGSMNRLTPM